MTDKLRQQVASQERIKDVLRGRNAETDALEKMLTYYPETGPLRRELYTKHMAFFEAGAKHHSRLCISANRVGKSEGILCYEATLHLTGKYPPWWKGRRFNRPITAWLAGKTSETTRDILQAKLLGRLQRDPDHKGDAIGLGTGMVPKALIISTTPKSGVPDGIDTVWVRHATGGASQLGFKTYGKDRDSFEGTEKDLIGLDEEPPSDVDDECSMRLMSTKPGESGGIKIITFTPLEGYTEVVKKYLESNDEGRFFIQIGWDDAPHISQEEKDRMSKQYLPAQLRARSKGEPSMGEGAIYPMAIEELLVDDFKLPDHFPRCFGLDVGKTAVLWAALDRDNDILYLYKEYYSEEYNTLLHAIAIKGVKGENAWIPGVIDPAALGSSQVDGQKLMTIYTNLGLKLHKADNAVWAGIDAVWSRMSTGRLRIFRSLRRLQNEYGRYHTKRRETATGISSQVVKKDDHLCDCLRYVCMSGIGRMKCRPSIQEVARKTFGSVSGDSRTGGWMH